jgi:uncharacterized RDD family membrane protein YckC
MVGGNEGGSAHSTDALMLSGTPLPIAALGARAAAFAVDSAVTSIPLGAVQLMTEIEPVALLALANLVYLTYFTVQWADIAGGRTLGMRLVGIEVVGMSGRRIGLGRSLVRYVVWLLGLVPVGLGSLWTLVDRQRQGWHDKVARTVVVRR